MANCLDCENGNKCIKCNTNFFISSAENSCVDSCGTDELLVENKCLKCLNFIDDCKSCISQTNCSSCYNSIFFILL